MYPGSVKNNDHYDPPSRGWFKRAPENVYYLDGPYIETFTRNPVIINLSLKKQTRTIS